MHLWQRLTARFGPQPDLLGFAADATPGADAWLMAFTSHFMQHPTAGAGTAAFMSGLRFFTAQFVAGIQALPAIETRRPPLAGRIPRVIYTTAGPIITDVYERLISRHAERATILTAFEAAVPALVSQNVYTME